MSDATPEPMISTDAPAVRAATYCLRIVVSWMCVGAAVSAWRGSDVGASAAPLMWLTLFGVTVETMTRAAATVLMLLAVTVAMRPTRAALYVVAVWFLMIAMLKMGRAGEWSALTPVSQMVRYVAPLAMTLLLLNAPREQLTSARAAVFEWMLRLAAAATFIGHGLKAFTLDSGFEGLIVYTSGNFFGAAPDQSVTHAVMRTIGAVDIIVAGLLVTFRWRVVAAYMALWGFVTAASRVTAHGFDWSHEFLIRLANGGVPLTLLLWWHLERTPVTDVEPQDADESE